MLATLVASGRDDRGQPSNRGPVRELSARSRTYGGESSVRRRKAGGFQAGHRLGAERMSEWGSTRV